MKFTFDSEKASEKFSEVVIPATKAAAKGFWTIGAGILGAVIDGVATAQKEYAVSKGSPTPLEKAKAAVEEAKK